MPCTTTEAPSCLHHANPRTTHSIRASYYRSPIFLTPHSPNSKKQIPKASAFNKIRLTLVALLAIPSAAEYYDFIANPLALRLGPNAWCMLAVMQVGCAMDGWMGWAMDRQFPPPPCVLYVFDKHTTFLFITTVGDRGVAQVLAATLRRHHAPRRHRVNLPCLVDNTPCHMTTTIT